MVEGDEGGWETMEGMGEVGCFRPLKKLKQKECPSLPYPQRIFHAQRTPSLMKFNIFKHLLGCHTSAKMLYIAIYIYTLVEP